jgi:hypothetical protein
MQIIKNLLYLSFSDVISKAIMSLCFTYKLTGVIRFPSLDLVGAVDNNDKNYPAAEKRIL